MHVHLVHFVIEDEIGRGGLRDGWKDVIMIHPGSTRSVVAEFEGEPGVYMMHCHILEHEDWDMMMQFQICDDEVEGRECDVALLGSYLS
mmetsp:Transcript_25808/g.52807  ORF Transcript_25808/g.52807 Transcript_25808/m.52807 type:complete len:89 (+) Transcript_25808:1-267(+)